MGDVVSAPIGAAAAGSTKDAAKDRATGPDGVVVAFPGRRVALPPAGGDRTTLVATLILLAAAWVYVAWPWISGRYTVPWDAKAHFQAQLDFLADSIHRGESFLWNPYIFAGWPQIADPQSLIFVPAFMLLALVDGAPSFAAMDATVYAALGLGGLALLGFFRDRGWHTAGGAVAALSFAFGGAAAWRVQHTGQVMSLAMLPIVLLFLSRTIERRSYLYGIATGITAGFMAVGRDQIALLGIYMLAAYAITTLLSGPKPLERIRGAIGPLVAGGVAAALVVAVPVAFSLVLLNESNRPEIDFVGAGHGSMHPASLITAAIADLFGQGAPEVDYWGPPSVAFGVTDIYLAQNMGAFYAGALPIVAILFLGIARGQLIRREIAFFSIFGLLFVLYALGWYTPAFRAMYDWLPGVKIYRRPADATFMIGFAISLLGGYAIHRWLTGEVDKPSTAVRVLQWAIAAIVFVALPVAFALHADRVHEAIKPTGIAMAFSLAAVVLLIGAKALPRRLVIVGIAAMTAFTALDLHINNAPNESTAYPSEVFEAIRQDTSDPTIRFLKDATARDQSPTVRDRVELVGLGFHWPNASMIHRLENTLGYNPLRIKLYAQATGAEDHVALPQQRVFSKLMPSYDSLLADMLGLKWIAIGVPLETIDPKATEGQAKQITRFPGSWIYENPGTLPRVMFVPEAKGADFATIVATGRWPEGFDPRRTVLVSANSPALAAPAAPLPAGTDLSKAVGITAYHNASVEIAVDAPVEGFVVLNDAYHRWWGADIDGTQAPVEQANVLFRAVKVPAGRHTLTFTFHPFRGVVADLKAKYLK